jgi:pseudouridine kinase
VTEQVGRAGRAGAGPVVVCAGGAVVDRHLRLLAPPVSGTSNPSAVSTSAGGVARNVAENLALLGARVRLVSRVGDDDAGRMLVSNLRTRGVDTSPVVVDAAAPTAQYVAVLDPAGELVIGAAAMEILDGVTPEDIEAAWPAPGEWLFVDCNVPAATLAAVVAKARADGTRLAVDAVSTPKVTRLVGEAGLRGIRVLFCNLDEARALLTALDHPSDGGAYAIAQDIVALGARAVVLTLGIQGVIIAGVWGVRAVPAVPARVVDVTGAGDALVAGALSVLARGDTLDAAVRIGLAAAAFTVASPLSVRPDVAASSALA